MSEDTKEVPSVSTLLIDFIQQVELAHKQGLISIDQVKFYTNRSALLNQSFGELLKTTQVMIQDFYIDLERRK